MCTPPVVNPELSSSKYVTNPTTSFVDPTFFIGIALTSVFIRLSETAFRNIGVSIGPLQPPSAIPLYLPPSQTPGRKEKLTGKPH